MMENPASSTLSPHAAFRLGGDAREVLARPKPAGVADIRQRNLRAALQLVLSGNDRVTRAEIARTTGLTSATVSSLLNELIDAGYVADGEMLESTGGKRPVALHIDRSRFGILVLLVRSSLLRAAVLDLTGVVVRQSEQTFTRPLTPEDVVAMARAAADSSPLSILTASVEIPGALEGDVVVESVQLGWQNVRVSALVSAGLDAPVFTVNDADAGALAEIINGPGPVTDQIYVDVSDGIGAAIFEEGTLLGRSRTAGEIGHVCVDYSADAPLCNCGRRGCLEAFASIRSLLDLDRIEGMAPEELTALAASDRARVKTARAAQELSKALSLLSSTLDIPHCVLGGFAYVLGSDFIAQLQRELDETRPRSARPITVAYANPSDPFVGAGQYALAALLGVRWPRTPTLDDVLLPA